jgi:hypothetical protein
MKKWITVLSLVLFIAAISTAVYAQDADKSSGRSGAVKLGDVKHSAFLTLDLQAGFPLDPFFVSINGGGEVDASTLDENCFGYINDKPVVTLNWEGQVDTAYIFFYSDHDPTLVIQMPDGSFMCNDDAHEHLLDPIVQLDNPPSGEYRLWVGSFDEGNLIPGILVVTTKSEFSVGNFDPGSFVKREKLARTPATIERQLPEARLLRAILADGLEAEKTDAPVLDATTQTITRSVVVTGATPAFMLPVAEASPAQLCSGLVNYEADAVFNLTRNVAKLNVFFEGESDSTLAVIAPDGAAHCIDNSSDGANLHPFITIDRPQLGAYGVVVGRFDPSIPITGVLTIDISGKLQPAVLAPETTNP